MGKRSKRLRKKIRAKFDMNRLLQEINVPVLPKKLAYNEELPEEIKKDGMTDHHESTCSPKCEATGDQSTYDCHVDTNTNKDCQITGDQALTHLGSGTELIASVSRQINAVDQSVTNLAKGKELAASISQKQVTEVKNPISCATFEKTCFNAINDFTDKQKVPQHIEKRIQLLLSQNADGIYLEKFSALYMREFGDTLIPSDLGFPDVIDLVKALPYCSMTWDESLHQMLLRPKTGEFHRNKKYFMHFFSTAVSFCDILV